MKRIAPATLLALCSLLVLSAFVQAQTVTVIGGGGDARACSLAAELSTTRLQTSRSALEPCNRALDDVRLSRRDRAATHVNRGILLVALEQYQDALDDYNAGLALTPDLPQAWNGKGNLYYLAERYDEAIAAYRRALELSLPERHVAFYNLGIAYEKAGDEEAAQRSYSMALDVMPDWAPAKEKLERLKGN